VSDGAEGDRRRAGDEHGRIEGLRGFADELTRFVDSSTPERRDEERGKREGSERGANQSSS
jgi:hypothetical protein